MLSMSTMHSHLFLSTPSARRATLCGVLGFHGLGISIHALREEGDALSAAMTANPIDFYPRPPRGGRPTALTAARTTVEFLSTPSARRATGVSVGYRIDTIISIHALREEGDRHRNAQQGDHVNFYPRPPRGGRPQKPPQEAPPPEISIHALREEGDAYLRKEVGGFW